MLTRQKIILALLEEAGEPLTRLAFVKMVFLLRHETSLKDESTFYDFVPYKYGPFSFVLYREISSLCHNGYISSCEDNIGLQSKTRRLTKSIVQELSSSIRSCVASIFAKYGKMQRRRLLRSVYSQYPWYATKSELLDLIPETIPTVPTARFAVYTVGYERKSVDMFFDRLLKKGIAALIDVRANPVSRKYGFARSSLSEIAAKLDIQYHHIPELGIVSKERVGLNDYQSYQRLLNRYERETLPKRSGDIERLIALLRMKPSALVCMEKDVECCHRGRLAKVAAKRSGLPVINL